MDGQSTHLFHSERRNVVIWVKTAGEGWSADAQVVQLDLLLLTGTLRDSEFLIARNKVKERAGGVVGTAGRCSGRPCVWRGGFSGVGWGPGGA